MPSSNNNKSEPINLLIFSPSPRNIPWFNQKLEILNEKYDVLRVKNDFTEIGAYRSGREFFLKHPEYTHLAILPDDLLVEVEQVDKLVSDLKKYNYPVLSGICNFAYSSRNFFERMSLIDFKKFDAVQELSRTGKYDYFKNIMHRSDYQKLLESFKNKKDKIVRAAYSAFPFMIIRRDIVEKIPFGANEMGVDTVFAQSCINTNTPIYVDLEVETAHLKGMEKNTEMSVENEFGVKIPVSKLAWDNKIDTRVYYLPKNPPKREELFLPKKIK